MHQALYIHEILLNIFGHCCPIESHWIPGRRSFTADLAALARTCRTFKDPALDVLWSELADLSPLVRCLPDVCQFVGPCYSFKRHLNETEWHILRSYTRRIWHINSYSNLHGWLDHDNFIAVCNPPVADPLFPNLRSFYWQGVAIVPVAHIAVPSLTSLDLQITHQHVPVLKDFLDAVGALCPNINRLRFNAFHCRTFHGVFATHICRWANLRVLDFHGIVVNANTMTRLSEISALAHLSFTLIPIMNVNDWIPASGSAAVFSRLTHLETASESLDLVAGLLSCIRLPALQNLVIVCPRRPSKENFRSYMTTARTVCSPDSLIKFTFLNGRSYRLPLLRTLDNEPDGQLTLDDLRPCMDFVNLREISLDIKWSVVLNDSDLLTLVSAWPHMRCLHLNTTWGWRTTGGITLRGLLQLLGERRRSLSVLCVAIHTQSFTTLPHELDRESIPSSPLRILVADSDIQAADVPALVDVLVELRPYLHFFVAPDDVYAVDRDRAVSRGREWRRVFDGVSERLSEL